MHNIMHEEVIFLFKSTFFYFNFFTKSGLGLILIFIILIVCFII